MSTTYRASLQDPHNVDNRTNVRLALLELGYTPVKLKGKAPRYKGWNVDKVDADLLRSRDWARDLGHANTGIRCDNVIGLDFDIDDKDLGAAFKDFAADLLPERSVLRVGRPPRWAEIVRGSVAKGGSQRYENPETGETAAIDVIGRKYQLAMYGVHPDTGQPYNVKGMRRASDLSKWGKPEVDRLLEAFHAFMDTREDYRVKLDQNRLGPGGKLPVKHLLTPETLIHLDDGDVLSVAQLAELGEFKAHCGLFTIRDNTTGLSQGSVYVSNGFVSVVDWPLTCRYTLPPASLMALDTRASLAQLAKLDINRG